MLGTILFSLTVGFCIGYVVKALSNIDTSFSDERIHVPELKREELERYLEQEKS